MRTFFCFIRHGETNWNQERRIQGKKDNILNETGKNQAKEVGELLKKEGINWDIIITSPLKRAYETATIIQSILQPKLKVIAIPAFQEREFGKAEGMAISKEIFDRIVIDEVDGMEKSTTLQKRVKDATLDLARKYDGKHIIVVAHSHVIKGLLTQIDSNYTFRDKMANSAMYLFEVENDKVRLIKEKRRN